MMYDWLRELFRYAGRLDPQQWMFLLAVVIVIGVICLRGFGSRSQY
jgi:hypothetical protein